MCLLFFPFLPTKLHYYDIIMYAVEIWGQERGREKVSGCLIWNLQYNNTMLVQYICSKNTLALRLCTYFNLSWYM